MNHITRRRVLNQAVRIGTAAAIGSHTALSWSQQRPIRIGCIQTLSGPAAESGEDNLLGTKIAVEEINRSGGIDGRQVELIVRDDKLNASNTVAAARELAGDGVNLIVGTAYSAPTLAVMPLLQETKLVWMSSGPAVMSLTHEHFNRNYFRVCTNAHMAYRSQAKLMAQRYPNITKWATILSDSQPTRDIQRTFYRGVSEFYPSVAKTQPELSEPIVVKIGATDIRNQISAIMASPAEGLFIGLLAGDAITFMQQARAFGMYDKIKLICEMSLGTNVGKALGRNTPNNFWSALTWHPMGYKNEIGQAMYKASVIAQKSTKISQCVATSHSAVLALAAAIRTAKSTETNAVIAALEANTFDSAYGKLSFRKADHQVLINQGVVRLGPIAADPGWEAVDFAVIPWQDAIEPASPGVPFSDKT